MTGIYVRRGACREYYQLPSCILCVCNSLFRYISAPGQVRSDTDLKFGALTSSQTCFCNFDQVTVATAALAGLLCHVDFPYAEYDHVIN